MTAGGIDAPQDRTPIVSYFTGMQTRSLSRMREREAPLQLNAPTSRSTAPCGSSVRVRDRVAD